MERIANVSVDIYQNTSCTVRSYKRSGATVVYRVDWRGRAKVEPQIARMFYVTVDKSTTLEPKLWVALTTSGTAVRAGIVSAAVRMEPEIPVWAAP